jgi:predicted dehydrogenase
MGCHIIDPAFWALDLQSPVTVEAQPGPFNDEMYPARTTVRWEFPARGAQPPVTMTWYGGTDRPFVPTGILPHAKLPSQGGLYYGEKGTLLFPHRTLGTPPHIRPTLLPVSQMQDFKPPQQLFARGTDHYQEWVQACKGGPKTSADFGYAGPLTETVLLGNLAALAGMRLFWDTEKFEITNMPEANKYLRREYREGWTL